MEVRPKKSLGQHFLNDLKVAARIVDGLWPEKEMRSGAGIPVVEVGPGTGVLTDFLLERPCLDYHAIELDRESVGFLQKNTPAWEAGSLRVISSRRHVRFSLPGFS